MKIAYVFPPNWTPHSDGSLQIWNKEVTKRLSARCDVLVYSGRFSFKSHDRVDGVSYRRFSTRSDNRLLKRFRILLKILGHQGPEVYSDLWYPCYAIKVALDLRKQGCDVVHVYYYPQFANLIKRLNPGIRVILNMHSEWLTQVKFTNLVTRLANIDLVISCSDFITKRTCAMFPQLATRCKTVPMGLSPDVFSRAYQNSGQNNLPPRRLLCIGRISPEKGVHILLDAFELIIRRYPDASLTIVGPEWIGRREEGIDLFLEKDAAASLAPFYEGSYLTQLKQRLSPEAAKRIMLAGLVSHDEVSAYYANSDIYVSPSLYESFGMSVIEAMAAGLPVVAARVRSFEDLITNERTGVLVESSNASAIADGVFKLSENEDLRKSISRAAHEMVSKQFSWDTICSSLLQMYRDVLDTNTAATMNLEESVTE